MGTRFNLRQQLAFTLRHADTQMLERIDFQTRVDRRQQTVKP